jgi:hypothetical protein
MDLCTKNWEFEGSADEITIYEFSITQAEVEFDRIFHNGSAATYEDIIVSGQVKIQDFVAQVFYNQTQPLLKANISYTSDVFAMNLTDLIYTPVNCSVEEQKGIKLA